MLLDQENTDINSKRETTFRVVADVMLRLAEHTVDDARNKTIRFLLPFVVNG
jgi:hypothetical protein